MRRLGLDVLLALAALAAAPAPSPADLAAQGKAAYAKGEFEEAYRLLESASEREPASWKNRYNLALAATKSKHFAEAARALATVVRGGIDLDFETAPELAPLRESAEWRAVREALVDLAKKRGANGARVAFTLAEKDLLTEGLAVDPATGDFFVSSVHRRKIVRRRADGAVSDFVGESGGGSWGVLALRVDPARRLLWAATAAVPPMIGYEKALEGKSRVDGYDLATGERRRRVELPGPGPHVANDLAIDASGRVYVSDSVDSSVYRIAADGASIETFVAPKAFRSPQGMALDAAGAHLYVADYGRGIFRVPIGDGAKVEELPAPPDAFLLGIDGLDRFGDSLVVTQNLARPDRVSRLHLAADGARVAAAEVLEINDARVAEPTLGVVWRSSFWFVADSQWGRFDEKTGAVDHEHLREPMILELPLALDPGQRSRQVPL